MNKPPRPPNCPAAAPGPSIHKVADPAAPMAPTPPAKVRPLLQQLTGPWLPIPLRSMCPMCSAFLTPTPFITPFPASWTEDLPPLSPSSRERQILKCWLLLCTLHSPHLPRLWPRQSKLCWAPLPQWRCNATPPTWESTLILVDPGRLWRSTAIQQSCGRQTTF